MKKLIGLTVAAFMLTGISFAQGASLPIEGSWETKQFQNEISFDLTFTIQANTLTITNVCTVGGNSATAHVSSPAQYDASTVTVLGSGEDQESNNGVNCNVSIHPDRMNYQIVGNTIIFTHDGSPEQLILMKK